jgi:hypothetical protein
LVRYSRQSWESFIQEPYKSRIPADPMYLQALGRAVYNFTYMEWIVVGTIVKLGSDGFGSVPKGRPPGEIARALIKVIDATAPPLSPGLRKSLVKIHERCLAAVRRRNKLLHAHPYTAPGGMQQLGGAGIEWPLEEVIAAAKQFESIAIEGNAIYYGDLAKERA